MLTEEKKSELKSKYGPVAFVNRGGDELAFRAPDFTIYQRFTDKVTSDKASKLLAMRELCISCIVFPETDEGVGDKHMARAFFDKPANSGVPIKLAGALQDLAGAETEIDIEGN